MRNHQERGKMKGRKGHQNLQGVSYQGMKQGMNQM